MSLLAFQQALCELIASPDLCIAVRSNPGVLDGYDLTHRERGRLVDVVWQRGMSTNCTLYRSNRITPIYTLLHYTCVVLGDRLKEVLDSYWASNILRDLEFKQETSRFAQFLKTLIRNGTLVDDYVEEVLDLELALAELRFAPRRKILREREAGGNAPHPLVRVVRFSHDAGLVLDALIRGTAPTALAKTECYLVLSRINDELEVTRIGVRLGRKLARAATRAAGAECYATGSLRNAGSPVPQEEEARVLLTGGLRSRFAGRK